MQGFSKHDVNVLVVDTEMYSNTGGQSSKATPIGASVVFSKGGKSQTKKQLGAIFMTYEHIYVASVCLSNQSQLVEALVEADRYDGPSIVIAYAPCIQQQVRPEGLNDMFNGTFYRDALTGNRSVSCNFACTSHLFSLIHQSASWLLTVATGLFTDTIQVWSQRARIPSSLIASD